ncbi:MAG: M48 family metallopeptidase [Actinobacteria bacterium]|nr:M48 family metallopeptidase [Actinomycetota bacterium]
MKINIFKGKTLLGFILITLTSLAILSLASILLVNLLYKPDYGDNVRQYFDDDLLLKASNYNRVSLNISIASRFLSWFIMSGIIIIFFKYFKSTPINILLAFSYIVLFYLLIQLILLPLAYFRGYIIEHRFGLSNQTIAMWFSDYLKENGISILISSLGITGIYTLMVYIPKYWWIISSAVLAIFVVAATYLYPILIDPLFYKFEKLKDTNFQEQIINITGKASIEVKEVLVADASRKTNKANAYFTGIGGSKRIVVFDNIINNFSRKEALNVIAHEIGHWHYWHIVKSIIIGIISGTAGLFLINAVFTYSSMVGDFKSILVIILLISIISFLSLPLQNAVSRTFERQADNFTMQATENPDAQIQLMLKLAESNLSNVSPHWYIKYFLYSHPPIMERVEAAKNFD